MVFHNTTNLIIGHPDITQGCFSWCQQQNFIHQSNLAINDLSFVVVALVALLVHHILLEFKDTIIEKTGMEEWQLNIIKGATTYLAFWLLIIFLVYLKFFKS